MQVRREGAEHFGHALDSHFVRHTGRRERALQRGRSIFWGIKAFHVLLAV